MENFFQLIYNGRESQVLAVRTWGEQYEIVDRNPNIGFRQRSICTANATTPRACPNEAQVDANDGRI